MEEASTAAVVLFLLAVVAAAVLRRRQRKLEKPDNLPPGPRGLPVIGNLHQLSGPLLHRSLADLARRHGPVMRLQLGQVPTVVVSGPSAAREVMKTHDASFCSRPHLVSFKALSYGGADVAMAPYGDHWRELRKLYILELLSARKLAAFRPVREEEVAGMIASVADSVARSSSSDSAAVNLSELMLRLSNTITCRVAFGTPAGGGGKYGERSRFHGVMSEIMKLTVSIFAEDFFPGSAVAWAVDAAAGLRRRLDAICRELDGFYDEIIREHAERATAEKEEEDFVDVLLRLKKEQPQLTMENVKAAILDIFVAGSDTSAATLVWAMSELANSPAAMSAARGEVRAAMSVSSKCRIDEDDLRELCYIKAVVSETLRLHPALPLLLPREAVKDSTVSGYDVAAGTRVIVNAWAVGRDPDAWEDPDAFRPERFLVGEAVAPEYKGHDFHFIPFGSGRRVCPGMSFGVATVELALANLLYAFDWGIPQEAVKGVDMEEAVGTVTQKKNPLLLVASRPQRTL